MDIFDEKAATWDEDPVRVQRANVIAGRMHELLDLGSSNSALEYGSGTGLLSFALKDELKKVVLMDASEGMTKVAIQKCRDQQIANLHPLKADLNSDDYVAPDKFDLVFSLLTFHHVDDTLKLLDQIKKIMAPGGILCIIDLEKEDGTFHDDEFHGHLGFDRFDLETKLESSGFKPYHYEVCYEIEKGEGDDKKSYPLFMMLARA